MARRDCPFHTYIDIDIKAVKAATALDPPRTKETISSVFSPETGCPVAVVCCVACHSAAWKRFQTPVEFEK